MGVFTASIQSLQLSIAAKITFAIMNMFQGLKCIVTCRATLEFVRLFVKKRNSIYGDTFIQCLGLLTNS